MECGLATMTADEQGGDAIHVLMAADCNYAMPLAVAICSAVANLGPRRITFHVVHHGFTPQLKARVERSIGRNNVASAGVVWIPIEINEIADLRIANSHLSPLAYARLLAAQLIPRDVSKLLYLDCDIVVRDDLGKLWEYDPGELALLAVRDRIPSVSAVRGVTRYRELNIPPDAKYFNSGVMLINLSKWRAENVGLRVLDYVRTYGSTLQMEDQEALNAVLFDDWGELPFRWNWQVPWKLYRTGKVPMPWVPSDEERSIIHFASREKPWLPGCDVPEKREFFHYLDRTDWGGWRIGLFKEILGRSLIAAQDARNAVGRLRRRLIGIRT